MLAVKDDIDREHEAAERASWPLPWYFTARDLFAHNDELRAQREPLDAEIRADAMTPSPTGRTPAHVEHMAHLRRRQQVLRLVEHSPSSVLAVDVVTYQVQPFATALLDFWVQG